MKFLKLDTTCPYLNLAIEEYLFNNSDDDVFMLWQNEPTVVIGRNQNAHVEINKKVVAEKGIHIARRITGGGAVYHDLGNLNYTFISSGGSRTLDFEYFTAPIIEALGSIGVLAELSGRNDLTVLGKKISGNAQSVKEGRVLHHGTILFDTDLDMLSSVLNVDKEKIKSKAVKSTRSRVTNIKPLLAEKMDITKFIALISDFIVSSFSPKVIAPPHKKEISELVQRNSSDAWLYPASPLFSDYSIVKKQRYDFGTVEIHIAMSGENIKSTKIHGDFFGTKDISELESCLTGKRLGTVDITLNISDYIFGMTNEEFFTLLYK